ncbi:hypothetical protein [Sinorhizobium fredii]|uniref:hypothetical protein n=1 Tax=Rhizobium fredii TaxID=380 RepID=UPI003515EAED
MDRYPQHVCGSCESLIWSLADTVSNLGEAAHLPLSMHYVQVHRQISLILDNQVAANPNATASTQAEMSSIPKNPSFFRACA